MLLLCALVAGSSSVWAKDVLYYTLDGTTTGTGSAYASANPITQNNMDWMVTGNTQQNPWRIGGKSLNNVDRPIYSTKAMGSAITEVKLTVGEASGITVNSLKLIVSSNADFAEGHKIDEVSATFAANSTISFKPTSPATQWAKDSYYKFVFNVSVTGTSNKFVQFTKAEFYAPEGTSTTVATPTISGQTPFYASTEVTITCETTGASIQYSLDNGSNWTAYSDPFTLTETKTVKAKATKSGSNDSEVASMTFTKVTPITVAAALTAINALADNGTIADQCVAGKISQVDKFSSGSIQYWISDDGTTTSQLEVFYGKGLYGANFTALTDLNVGDEVTVYGTLKKYVSGETTTPEFISGSQLLSYKATETPAPVITASNVTIDSEATSGEITYTIDNPTTATLTAAEKEEYDWISNVTVAAGKVTFTVIANTGAERTAVITLSYTGATNKYVTITQKAAYGTATVPFAFDGGKSDIENTAGLTHDGLGSDYDYSPKLKFDNTGDYLILKINGAAEKLYFDIKGNSFSGGTFTVQTSANGQTYTDLKTYTTLGAVTHEALDLASTVRYIKWIYTTKSGGNVALGRIGVDCEAAYIPSAGYATYTTPNIVDFSGTGVTAYKVSAVNANNITLEEVTKAPAGTPLVLQATAGNYALDIIASADEITGNELLVSTGGATTDDNYTVYALANKTDGVGFYKVQAGIKVPAGKAYLKIANPTSAREYLGFNIGGDATSVNDVRGKMEEVRGEVYDLSGRRIQKPTKGLYIQNGKKILVK